jgi:hypothetical protein
MRSTSIEPYNELFAAALAATYDRALDAAVERPSRQAPSADAAHDVPRLALA